MGSVLHSVVADLAAFGLIGTFAGVVLRLYTRHRQVGEVPWWWWILSAFFLAIAGLATQPGIVQGLALLAGGMAFGVGCLALRDAYREGGLRLRPLPGPSSADHVAEMDWAQPIYTVHVTSVTLGDIQLNHGNPYFDFVVKVLNGNVYDASLQPDVRGRIQIDNEELNQPPTLTHIEENGVVRRVDSGWEANRQIHRNRPVSIMLRQHLLPEVATKIRQREAWFGFQDLDIGVCLLRSDETGQRVMGPRHRLQLETYRFSVP